MTFGYYKNCLYTHRYKFSSEEKKKKQVKCPKYMVSHHKIGLDLPIRLDRESGRDKSIVTIMGLLLKPRSPDHISDPNTYSGVSTSFVRSLREEMLRYVEFILMRMSLIL